MNRRPKHSDIDTGRMATAYHEAGHAVMALAVGRPVEKVTIIAAALQTGGSRLGACKVQKGRSKASKDGLEDEAMILLAGMVGESHFTRRYSPDGAAQDLRMAQRLLSDRAGSERQLERLLTRVLKKTEHVLAEAAHVDAIASIATELYEKETISGRAVRQLMQEAEHRHS
ncbi:MAG: hypothetical protein NXI04_04950 [Planctomycetaceae bacterium]|nr:hypothetical protein [Planctomycetaceae bacterium]